MDNSSTSWATRPALLAAGWGLAALMAGTAVFSALADSEPMGAILFGLAAIACGAFAAHGTLLRPRLTADIHGIAARTMSGTVKLDWAQARVRLRTTRRLGRDALTLEIDGDDHLVVLGWMELGEDPRDVLDVLSALRAHS